MSEFVVHALLSVADGATNEVSREAADLTEALALIREVAEAEPGFVAVTLMHIEEHPRFLEGAAAVPPTT